MGDLTISASALAVVTTVVGGLVAALTYLYFSGRSREKELTDRQIQREQEVTNRLIAQVDRLIPAVEEQKHQIQELVSLVKTLLPGSRRA